MEKALPQFQRITLEETDSLKSSTRLMDRYDTKFVFHRQRLLSLLKAMVPFYKVLEINDQRLFKYDSLYFDTENFLFYHQHHNQRVNRIKIRYRQYVDNHLCYLEVKLKTNKGKTLKTRLKEKTIKTEFTRRTRNFITSSMPDNKIPF